MSLGYAEKLSWRDDLGGQLGSREVLDAPEELAPKLDLLCKWVADAREGGIVCFTGAGISTACGIPDFRGPSGIWTLQKKGLPMPKLDQSFAAAVPSLTHQVIAGLVASQRVGLVVSQNVDCLHFRSGVPPAKLGELHGNCFCERCPRCGTEYYRSFELETVGLKETGRVCTKGKCRGRLRDSVLDWEDPLPEALLEAAEQACSQADLVLCLGTSLQIRPACNIPQQCLKRGGRMVLVNLQRTPKDKRASLVIRARVDEVLSAVSQRLGLPIPPYSREDAVHVAVRQLTSAEGALTAEVEVQSVDGPACPLPFLLQARFGFEGGTKTLCAEPPFKAQHTFQRPGAHACRITLVLTNAADEDKRRQEWAQQLVLRSEGGCGRGPALGRGVKRRREPAEAPATLSRRSFVTQTRDYGLKAE